MVFARFADINNTGRVIAFDAGTSFSNSNTQTSVLSAGAISGGFPAGVNAGDTIKVTATGYWLNNSGAGQTWTWALKFGSTTIGTGTSASITAGANKHRWYMDFTVVYLAIGASSSIMVTGFVNITTTTTANFDTPQGGGSNIFTGGTTVSSLNTSAGGTLDIMCTHSTATATSTSACEGMTVRFFPFGTMGI